MATEPLAQRLAKVEERLATVEKQLANENRQGKDWRRSVAKYSGDEDILSMIRDGEKIREADRKSYRKLLSEREKRRK